MDLATGCDLGDAETQKPINHDLETCEVLVTILQPNCRSVGKLSYVNSVHHADTWNAHLMEDLPHIRYCGEVALKQMELGRYWIREQPAGSWIDTITPWPEAVAKHVTDQRMDQCATGAKDCYGMPVKKATDWTTNHECLVRHMDVYTCDGTHYHGNPTGKALENMKLYSWKLSGVVVTGIQALKTELRNSIYPCLLYTSDAADE